MIRKILITTFFLLNFATLASASDGTASILYQTITQQEALDLNLTIPSSTLPGFKSLEVKVAGAGQAETFKKILFCKSINGTIHWTNICPDLTAMAAQSALNAAQHRSDLPPYNPLSEPRKTTDVAVVAFAALTAVTGAGALATKILNTNENPSTNQAGYMAQLSRGGVIAASSLLGRGDKRTLRRKERKNRMDRVLLRSEQKISGISPLVTRIISDGNYLRSLVGPISYLLYPIAISLGWWGATSHQRQALPPTYALILAMMLVGVLDSLAGVVAALTFGLSIAIDGNINSLDSALTIMGVSLLVFSPALLAGAFRPFRRSVWNFSSLWERCTDYLLASILTGWVVQQLVLGLPGLAGLQLPTTIHARQIAIYAAALIVLRFAAEDLALLLFPKRLNDLEPEYRARSIFQQMLSTAFKVAIFGIIAGKFIGISAQLFIGIGLFALPLLMGIFVDKFPKSAALQRWMPTGIIEMLTMTVVGFFLAGLIQHRYPDARTYVLISFILLSIPGLVLKLLTLFGIDGDDTWKVSRYGSIVYRTLGIVALGILIYIIFSGILISNNV